MIRLNQELKDATNNILVYCLNIEQFYQFYYKLRDVLPVMNLINEKFNGKEVRPIIEQFHLGMSIGNKFDLEFADGETTLVNQKIASMSTVKDDPDESKRQIPIRASPSPGMSAKMNDDEEKKEQEKVDTEEDKECCLCLFEKNELVLPCTHAFCEGCIKDWFSRNNKECPICR